MSTVHYRPDYAKFLFDLPRGVFTQYYHRINALSHERKYHGDWLNSHKVTALYNQQVDRETTVLEIWGEWAGIVRLLPYDQWATALRRFDVRAIIWDADKEAVLAVGQLMQRNEVRYNVEVFNSKPASKRLGRDRGGVGFRLGSRKSDMCVVCYKRGAEPVALEVRMQGQILRNALRGSVGHAAEKHLTIDSWALLIEHAEVWGQKRLQGALERCGIGTYWPVFRKEEAEAISPLQQSFVAPIEPTKQDLEEYAEYIRGLEEAASRDEEWF